MTLFGYLLYMRVKYIVTENQFKNLLKKFTSSNKSKPVERIKNEIENLEGKTVTFDEVSAEDGEKYDTNVFRIKNPKYEVIDAGKKLRGLISFVGEDLQNNRRNDRYLVVDLIDGQVRIYGFDIEHQRWFYRNEKLEKYLESLNEKFPIFWKDKDPLQTDF